MAGRDEKVINKLRAFKPTKVMVEWEKTEQEKLDSYFQDYLAGKVVSSNEIVQLSFPLIKETGSDLLAVD